MSTILSVTCPPELYNLKITPEMTPSQKHRMNKKFQEWNKVSACKDIVVYGSNLPSGVGSTKQLNKHIYFMYGLPPFQLEVLIGLLLSDGWLIIDKQYRSINARFGLKQSMVNFPFLWYVFNILSHYCRNLPHPNHNTKRGKVFYNLTIQTRAFPVLTELYNIFYVNGVKIVPASLINYLTPVSLAFWIMGDGFSRGSGVAICTDSYTLEEIELIISALYVKFGLRCTKFIQDKESSPIKYRIYIRAEDMPILIPLVGPHMYPTMLYKLGFKKV